MNALEAYQAHNKEQDDLYGDEPDFICQNIQDREFILEFFHSCFQEAYKDGVSVEKYQFYKKDIEEFESFDTGNGYTFETCEYNTACHCHPEYQSDSYHLDKNIADTFDKDIIVGYIRSEMMQRAEKEYMKYHEEEEAKRLRVEAQEKKQLEKLKAKYEADQKAKEQLS